MALSVFGSDGKAKARERDALPMISIVRREALQLAPLLGGEEKEMGRDLWRHRRDTAISEGISKTLTSPPAASLCPSALASRRIRRC